MTIMPIFTRELVAAARRSSVQWHRSSFAATLMMVVGGTFAAQYYRSGGDVSNVLMARVAQLAFGLIMVFHALLCFSAGAEAALSVAAEKDRRTLDFLLATPLDNAEIVLGKLATCLVVYVTTVAAGIPIMVLLNLLGGIDSRLILLACAGTVSTTFFFTALSLWVSTGAPDARRAVGLSALGTMAWLFGPLVVTVILPRFGVHLPGWIATANAWLLASSPVGLMMNIAGVMASGGLLASVAWMIGLQAIGGILLLIASIARLRSAYRVNLGGDGRGLGRARGRPVWRFRPRPSVGDDPILWKEKYTIRGNSLARVFGFLFYSGALVALASVTFYFAAPAVIEVWNHGYTSGVISSERPEMNLFTRFFVPGGYANAPVDMARTDFNLFLRFTTAPFAFFLPVLAMALVAEMVTIERARETWTSVIATPLDARDILRAEMLAAVWRLRGLIATLLVLWTLGLIAGAIHPFGYLVTLLGLAASTWFFVAFGALAMLRPKGLTAVSPVVVLAMLGSGTLPFLLPGRMSSVLLAAGSPPFTSWLSLVSYRDLRAGLHYASYPPLHWMNINTGEGLLPVVATCLIGIIVPALGGLFAWRYAIAHFDRLIGRPWREAPVSVERIAPEPIAVC